MSISVNRDAVRTVLITGCSSGIGQVCALGLKARGWRVFATARHEEDLQALAAQGLEALYLDYAEPDSIAACVEEVRARTGGRLFALFNNGAYGQLGAVEDLSRELLEAQFQANFFGWHDLTVRVLPLMRTLGRGRIVQNSSVLGLVAMKWRGAYNASKFAVEGLTDTLRLELRGSGIHVSIVEPGPIHSRFVENALRQFEKSIDWRHSRHREMYERRMASLRGEGKPNPFKLPPEAVLKKLIHALESRRPKVRYYVTTPTHVMAFLRRVLPYRALDVIAAKASDDN